MKHRFLKDIKLLIKARAANKEPTIANLQELFSLWNITKTMELWCHNISPPPSVCPRKNLLSLVLAPAATLFRSSTESGHF